MHAEARQWIADHANDKKITVLECGSRDINGTVRDLFPNAKWIGVDTMEGGGVDVVADFAKYRHDKQVNVVVCCEVLEHAKNWRELVKSAAENLRKGGTFLVTAAGPTRVPHSALDGGFLRAGEYYGNIHPDELAKVLDKHFTKFEIDVTDADIRAVAKK